MKVLLWDEDTVMIYWRPAPQDQNVTAFGNEVVADVIS